MGHIGPVSGLAYAYLHGLGSGPSSRKGAALRARYASRGVEVLVPELHLPSARQLSIRAIWDHLMELDRSLGAPRWRIVGSSLGGWLAGRMARETGRVDARFYLSPLIDGDGRQTGWMASITDITEPKRVRAQLEAAHERFVAILDGLDAAVYVADAANDEILFANRAFKSIYGFDAVGQRVGIYGLPTPPDTNWYDVDPRRLSPQQVPRELYDGELQNGLSGRWYHIRERATRWVDGRVVRMAIATDITDKKRVEEENRAQQERLQRTSRLITMGEMASTLAHELNQPLAAVSN